MCTCCKLFFTSAVTLQHTEKKIDLPVEQASLIPSEHLEVIRELGEGHYAVVHLGEWKRQPGDQKPVRIFSYYNY